MKDRKTKPPLLYIAQNKETLPNIDSQSIYYSANNDERKAKEIEAAKSASRSRFKSLSIDEKLVYITNMQETLPQLRCRIFTQEETITGNIESIQEEQVQIKVIGQPRRRNLTKSSIQDIQILGF